MLKANNKNTRKKYEIFPGGNYSEKNVWGEFHGGKFSEGEVIVQRGAIYGQLSGEAVSRGKLIRDNCPGGKSLGGNCSGGNFMGAIVRVEVVQGGISQG